MQAFVIEACPSRQVASGSGLVETIPVVEGPGQPPWRPGTDSAFSWT